MDEALPEFGYIRRKIGYRICHEEQKGEGKNTHTPFVDNGRILVYPQIPPSTPTHHKENR